ncbi:type II toxin-antitoxin system RelE/ParE family toxin [Chryseobacterium taichungense]|uniref:type II toxin-antitoxin system RelE/ParE family toxin n=1 Tax=Chryseobacterium taichungense TaxID=295069 RepID=UPI0028AE9BA4|nr:type II toxin-antitoxin system RelE/ParE family toxin [Chryseobacterium taichungense]
MEIIWSEEALENYIRVIDYLLENWTLKEVERFENNFNRLIENIKSHVAVCPISKVFDLRKCIIDENNSLIYKEINDKIFLITLVNHRSYHIY